MRHRCYRRWGAAVVAGSLAAGALVTASASAGAARSHASSGGTLKVAVSGAMTSLSPWPFGQNQYYLVPALYDTLVVPKGKGAQVAPALATSWTLSSNDKVMTLHLRHGVHFSDGSSFGASAVIWNIHWVQKAATGAQTGLLWQHVSAKALGRYTLRLSANQPLPQFYAMLEFLPIAKPGAEKHGIGTGPFEVQSFTPGTSIKLVRNPHYWGPRPKLDGITFTNYPSQASAALALRSGTVDLLEGPQFSELASLKGAGDKVATPPPSVVWTIEVNTKHAPLNNVKVRQALSLAFNRKAFAKTVFFGYGKATADLFPPGSPAYSKSLARPSFNLQKAKKLLVEAGYKHLKLSIDAVSFDPQTSFLPVYQQDLAKIGVTLTIKTIDPATLQEIAPTGKFPQLLTNGMGNPSPNPAIVLQNLQLRPFGNVEHFSSKTYAKMVSIR